MSTTSNTSSLVVVTPPVTGGQPLDGGGVPAGGKFAGGVTVGGVPAGGQSAGDVPVGGAPAADSQAKAIPPSQDIWDPNEEEQPWPDPANPPKKTDGVTPQKPKLAYFWKLSPDVKEEKLGKVTWKAIDCTVLQTSSCSFQKH